MNIDNLLSVVNIIDKEPDMKSPNPLGFLNKGRGESVYLNVMDSVKFAGVLEFLPGLGVRGKHFHKGKREIMYVLEGKIKGCYWLPDNPDAFQERMHEKGDLITMLPGLAHAFEAVDRTVMIELSPDNFNIEDTFYQTSGM